MKQKEIETNSETKDEGSKLEIALAIAPACILGGVLAVLSHIA